MPDDTPHSGMSAEDLERLRVELKAAMERSAEQMQRVDRLLAEKRLASLEETSDGLFHSRARPHPKDPPEA